MFVCWRLHLLVLIAEAAREDVFQGNLEPDFQDARDAPPGRTGKGGKGMARARQTRSRANCTTESEMIEVLRGLGIAEHAYRELLEEESGSWGFHTNGCHATSLCLSKRHQEVQGNFSSVSKLVQLQTLVFHELDVVGDLRALADATTLESLFLGSAQVSGDLAVLRNTQRIYMLRVNSPHITGNLEVLAGATELTWLSLHGTQVTGDLKALASSQKLHYLDLAGLQITGDLAEFRGFESLIRVVLGGTHISGDVGQLALAQGRDYHGYWNLKELDLSQTQVRGDLQALLGWQGLEKLDVSGTQVHGQLNEKWQGAWKKLKILKLSGSRVSFAPEEGEDLEIWFNTGVYLQSLRILELEDCPVNATVMSLLWPLAMCQDLSSIKAARASLRGVLKDVAKLEGRVGFSHVADFRSSLASSLIELELGYNQVSHVEGLPESGRTLNLAGNPVSFAEGVLEKALRAGMAIDLRDTSPRPEQARRLLEKEVVKKSSRRSIYNKSGGFECYDVAQPSSFLVTPSLFFPEDFCACSPGWTGSGVHCRQCPRDHYKPPEASVCMACPSGSISPEGSISLDSCRCRVGQLVTRNSTAVCGCPRSKALLGDSCVPCDTLNLDCALEGLSAALAMPASGHARLATNETRAFMCLEKHRCNGTHVLGCSEGYAGTLCTQCAAKHYADGKTCRACPSGSDPQVPRVLAALAVVVALGVLGAIAWMRRSPTPTPPSSGSAWAALKALVFAEAPILLQFAQLWAVLAALRGDAGSPSSFWEVPYVQALQLSMESLKGSLSLQCKYGDEVRVWLVALGPVLPLVLLTCCLVLERVRLGLGISSALKVVTLLYIGGASSCADLLSCQTVDGQGEPLPEAFHFRKMLPHIRCKEPGAYYVDVVGMACALGYGLLIPSFLGYLYLRQQLVLQSRTTATLVTDDSDLVLHLGSALSRSDETLTSEAKGRRERRLLAAAAAYISVLLRGRVQVKLVEDMVTAHPLEGCQRAEEFGSVDLFAEEVKREATAVQCRYVAEMLLERSMLKDASEDRVLTGAQDLLKKYALGRNLRMEILSKLAAVAMVSVVSMVSLQGLVALRLLLGISLLMAATVATEKPYVQPQVNTLQCSCFLSLSLAAVSFSFAWPWMSRVALALPFLLAALQALQPDSAENLALRLWEAMERGEMEVTAHVYSFL